MGYGASKRFQNAFGDLGQSLVQGQPPFHIQSYMTNIYIRNHTNTTEYITIIPPDPLDCLMIQTYFEYDKTGHKKKKRNPESGQEQS